MKCKYILIFSIVLLFCSFSSFSQELHEQYKFKQLTIDEGLSNNRTTGIVKDNDGFIWIGTDDGISRFDGTKIKTYNTGLNNSDDQWNQRITGIHIDNNGNLWKAALDLFIYNKNLDIFEQYFPDSIDDTPNRIRSLYHSEDGWLWIGARNGLYKLNVKTGNLYHFPPDIDDTYYEIWDFTIYDNKVWLGTRKNGLVVFNLSDNSYKKIVLKNGNDVKPKIILCTYIEENGLLWVGTKYNGLFKVNTSNGEVICNEYPDKHCKRIRKIIKDKSGNIWIGTMEGLYVIYNNTDKYVKYAHMHHEFSKLSHNSIFDIYIDNNDIMWLCTYAGGVNYTDLNRKPITTYTEADKNNRFLNDAIVAGITEDKQGNLYIGTDHGGLNILNPETEKFTYIEHGENKISGTNIKCLLTDNYNNIWIGTYGGGVCIYNPRNKSIKYISNNKQKPELLSDNIIYSMTLDGVTGNVWIGTEGGVDLINSKSYKVTKVFYNDEINQVYCDSKNEIWTGATGKGIYKYDRHKNEFVLYFKNLDVKSIFYLFRDSKDHLWIGGKDGLSRINLNNYDLKKFSAKDGLPSDIILGIMEDNNNNIWLSTSNGIAKCINAVNEEKKSEIIIYKSDDGLQSNQFWRASVYKDKKGKFYFGGVKGFNSFYPELIKKNPYPPKIVLTGLKIFNKNIEIDQKVEGEEILKCNINETQEIELSYKHKIFTIEFEALHYSNPENNKYAYKLEPLDKEWIYTESPRNFVTYISIRGGKYIFKVKGANSDGVWNENPRTLIIKIIPPFWRTLWFIILTSLIFVSILIALYYIRIKNIQKRNTQLEEAVKIRTKEISLINEELNEQKEKLQELNSLKDKFFSIIAHDLKNPFQSLMGFSDILYQRADKLGTKQKAEYISMINKASKKIYNLLENLLTWSRTQTNGISFYPETIDLSKIISQNIKLLDEKYSKQNISILNYVKEKIYVHADENMINLVLRNLLINAIKFSDINSVIEVFHNINNNKVKVSVKDNGIGIHETDRQNLFKLATITPKNGTDGEKGTGLGLVLCKEFITKNAGEIWVESKLGVGSTFHFTLPLKKVNN